eukprot:333120_1
MLQESGLLSPNDIEIMDVVDQIKNNKQKSLTQMSIKSGTSTNNSEMFKKKGKINQAKSDSKHSKKYNTDSSNKSEIAISKQSNEDKKENKTEEQLKFENDIWNYVLSNGNVFHYIQMYYRIVKGCVKDKMPKHLKEFVRMNQKETHLKLTSVECQWKFCENKNDYKKNGMKFRKCKACKIVRYCGKKCQKFDWNVGYHKQICLFVKKAAKQS